MIRVLDHGYVKLADCLGDDLSIVNAARVSYDKESKVLTGNDKKLINFLVKNHHDSPLRHAVMTFEVYAPLVVKNQWIKHAVASAHIEDQHGWNESSRRYVTENPEFYTPDQFSLAPDDLKQGSAGPMSWEESQIWEATLNNWYVQGEELYEQAMDAGMAPEQARLFLPAYGLYVRWRWTASLNAILNFLSLRLDHGAQQEIVEYAQAIATLTREQFPETLDAWISHRVV